MLLHAMQYLTETKLLGKALCEPCTATARWTEVRLLD